MKSENYCLKFKVFDSFTDGLLNFALYAISRSILDRHCEILKVLGVAGWRGLIFCVVCSKTTNHLEAGL